ncbi:matrilysin-like [Lytechinus variegatus]|uniref:matrilysin-like n=1 Tax=Lytechinus variegatus TaxID=7654 RepID=UPI001BB0D900|nr:matrilysin-like [Lytechinus variegatus]
MATLAVVCFLMMYWASMMAMPIPRDTLSEGHGFEDPGQHSKDVEAATSGVVSTFVPLDDSEVAKYFQDYGFLPQSLHVETDPESVEVNLTDAILKFQDFFELPPTGVADARVQELIDLPRCGLPDVFSFSVGFFRWYDLNLTYRIVELDDSMPLGRQVIGDVIRDAMQMWMSVTSLILCEVNDPDVDVDIHIRHFQGEHGDGISFDGPGGTLGHAFLPTFGEVHLDAAENWTVDTGDGIDYFQVVVHEIGHALGLMHSGVEGAIMYPFYRFRSDVELHQDDIQGIQLMYGTPDDLQRDVREHRCPYSGPTRSPSGQRQGFEKTKVLLSRIESLTGYFLME